MHGKGKSLFRKWRNFRKKGTEPGTINSFRVGGHVRSVLGMQKDIEKPGEILSRAVGKEQEKVQVI